jgi:hypothetical protein
VARLTGVASLGLLLASAAAAQRPTDRRIAAVVRADGFVIPIAEFVRGSWSNEGATAWGLAGDTTSRPPVWFTRRGPAPSVWSFGSPLGDAVTIRTSRIVEIGNHCQKNWALSSDLPATPLRRSEHPRNLGLAVSATLPVDAFVTVDKDSDAARRIVAFLTPALNGAEDDEIRRRSERWPEPWPAAEARRGLPVQIDTIVRTRGAINGRVLYHVRVVRIVRRDASPRTHCSESGLNVWIAEDAWLPPTTPDYLRIASTDYSLDGCDSDRKGTTLVTPLGLVTIDGRTFIVSVEHGYEDERYAILDTTGVRVRRVFGAEGGGC